MPDVSCLLPWVLVFVISAIAVRVVGIVALRNAVLDMPNERSSHKQPVPRLGGAAFIPVIAFACCILAPRGGLPSLVMWAVLVGSAILYTVSLIDDFLTVSAQTRFAVQFVAAGCVLWAATAVPTTNGAPSFASAVGGLVPSSVSYVLLAFWIVGMINLYNFMDGIDGIAGSQAVVAGAGWWILGATYSVPFIALVGSLIVAGTLGFLTVNWPPAKIFMGDAGSTVSGYFFAVAPIVATVEDPREVDFLHIILFAALLVWPFLADGTFTIVRRLRRGENIFKAHRSHLYQRLVIAGKSHQHITLVYGALAGVGAGLAWCVIQGISYSVPAAGVIVTSLFVALWRWTVACERAAGLT